MRVSTKVFTIVLCCIGLLILTWIFIEDIVWFFKKDFLETTNLSYDKNTSSIAIWYPDNNKKVIIYDTDKIDKLISMLNSFEVVERKIQRTADYSEPNPYICISVGGDTINISNRYITIFNNGEDWNYKVYYVKNQRYPFHDERNEIAQYLNNLME